MTVSWDAAVVLTWLSVLLVGGIILWLFLSVRRANRGTESSAYVSLMHQGYKDLSPMTKDANGNWVGTATKDGRTVPVAVDVRDRITVT